ncbi:hypothetical protein ACF3NR_04785 [Vaginella massiliensis]|uniref:hypothetical protein n=1 Tax=Vaginella massiliensis TaxID=1816680 RepID=UPI003753027F
MNKNNILVVLYPHTKKIEGSLLEYLVNGLNNLGYHVSYIDFTKRPRYSYAKNLTDKILNIYNRVVNHNKQYIHKLENDFYNKFYFKKLKEFKKCNTETFDYILVIKPELRQENLFSKILNPLQTTYNL